MKRISKQLISIITLLGALFAITGCSSILEEDPNDQQIPWATPAKWEGQVPGMPTGGSGY